MVAVALKKKKKRKKKKKKKERKHGMKADENLCTPMSCAAAERSDVKECTH